MDPRRARAETYPSHPVRIVVATTAGGGTDLAARLTAQWLTDKLGQWFVVENRPGGNNNIGTEVAARSEPDGYTLFIANSVNSINTALYGKPDFIADFTPFAIRSWRFATAHDGAPGGARRDSAGIHRLCQSQSRQGQHGLRRQRLDRPSGRRTVHDADRHQMVHVPYWGNSVAMTDLLGGQAQVLFATTGSSIQFAKAGTVRALAVTTAERLPALPDVPTLAQFLPGYEASGWSGLCVPKHTPADIVALLNKQINAALLDPTVRQHVADTGGTPGGGSAAWTSPGF